MKRSSTSNMKYVDLTKHVRELRAENEELRNSAKDQARRTSSASEMSLKLARIQNVNSNHKKLLREKDEELSKLKTELVQARQESDRLLSELHERRLELSKRGRYKSEDPQRLQELQRTVSRLEEV